jgi:hypothetical protein
MKIKGAWLAPSAPPVLRGRALARDTKQGTVVQKWPRTGIRDNTQDGQFLRDQFAVASKMASDVTSLDRETAENFVKGTTMVYRDALIAAIYGRLYQIVGPDGVPWNVVPKTRPHATPIPPEPSDMPWKVLAQWSFAVDGATAAFDLTALANSTELLIFFDAVTCSVSAYRIAQVSDNGGATFYSTFGQYKQISANGVTSDQIGMFSSLTQTAVALRNVMQISCLDLGNHLVFSWSPHAQSTAYQFVGSVNPINAIRIKPTGGTFNGGVITILGK